MAAPKGQEKKGGRIKGTPNKENKSIRDAFQLLVENNIEKLQADFDALKEVERIKYTIELAKFCLPTLKAVEMQGEIKTTVRQPIVFVKK
jgi:hypothetical protein